MSLSRRKMLALIGGGTILAATAGAGAFIATRTPHAAFAPWTAAGNYPDLPRRALSYALLAPNPHNRQPWVADITGADTLTLYRDHARNLPETDPFDRQLTIGMGCFLELMVQAAAQEGIGCNLTLFPDGDGPDSPVAHAHFTGTAAPDPLFTHALTRHTDRAAYDLGRPVPQDALTAIAAASVPDVRAAGTVSEETVAPLRALTFEGMEIELLTPAIFAESIDLTRIGRAQIEADPDGISLPGAFMETAQFLGFTDREAMMDPNGYAMTSMLAGMREAFFATPAFFWLATPGNSREQQIAAGRAWVRAHLTATALGLSVQPISQTLQEYPEMADHRARIHAALAQDGEVLQMLGRLGYGPGAGPAPRWPLETRMLNG